MMAILALFLVPAACLHAQRGRGGGNGGGVTGGPGGFRGNPAAPAGDVRPQNATVTRPSNGVGNPGSPDAKSQKAADNKKIQPNKVAEEIGKNPQAQKNVERILPISMSLDEASSGFKNRGQFISALHASKNLEIPFTDLKSRMIGDDGMSLGKAIHSLKPELTNDQVDAETKKAERQAKETEKA
jgi:hypothetical protein